MKSITAAWLASAHDDLVLIHEIANNETLTHLIAYHAQQAIEKSFKVVFEECENNVPKMHALEILFPKVLRHLKIPFPLDLLEDLDKLYIDARYPGDFGLLPSGKPTVDEAKSFLELAEQIHQTCRLFLSSEHR